MVAIHDLLQSVSLIGERGIVAVSTLTVDFSCGRTLLFRKMEVKALFQFLRYELALPSAVMTIGAGPLFDGQGRTAVRTVPE